MSSAMSVLMVQHVTEEFKLKLITGGWIKMEWSTFTNVHLIIVTILSVTFIVNVESTDMEHYAADVNLVILKLCSQQDAF